jgi:hypothetical protein
MKLMTLVKTIALLIAVLTASSANAADVTTVDFMSLTERPADWTYLGDVDIEAGQGLVLGALSAAAPNLSKSTPGWSIRTQAQLRKEPGLLGIYVGALDLETVWTGVLEDGGLWNGLGRGPVDTGEPIDFGPVDQDIVLQFDTFDGNLRAWVWPPGDPPSPDASPLLESPIHAPDSLPGLWTGEGSKAEAVFRYMMFSPEHIPIPGPSAQLLGDFDEDGILTAIDIDQLNAEILTPTGNLGFDTNGDGQVDLEDRRHWVEDSSYANTFFGDADLNRVVDFPDFLQVSDNFGLPGGWAQGDFDGSGEVNFTDFLALATNFGRENKTPAAAVPEPSGICMAMFGALGLICFRRRRCSTVPFSLGYCGAGLKT